jgi:hypothetical protein
VGLAFDQYVDIVAIHFDALGFFEGDGVGLMRGLLQHGREAEELAT